jgi:ribonuclease D
VLIDIAYNLPSSEKQLAAIEGISPKLVGRAGKQLIEALSASKTDNNEYQPPKAPDEAQKKLLKDMQSLIAECARDLKLAAETVASKRELSAVISSGNRETRVFTGWRRELVGERLLQLL